MEEAKTMYLKRIKLQNKGVPEELRMEANNEIGSNSSGQINKWQIEIYDESYATNEICTQALTYCNENGDMKLFSHEMNDLETSKETVDLTWSDKDTNWADLLQFSLYHYFIQTSLLRSFKIPE